MANAAQNDIILVTFFGSVFNQLVMLTHHYKIFSIVGEINILDVQDDVLAAVKAGGGFDIETPYTGCLTGAYSCTKIRAQRVYPSRARFSETPGTLSGTLGAAQVTNVSGAIELFTESAGRSQLATKHIGPMDPSPDSTSSGTWDLLAINALAGLRDQLLEPITVALGNVDLLPVIFHRGAVSPKFDTITDGTVQDTVRVQRTRTVGHGK